MPVATVTVRQLKNRLSGLDLSIPTVKEIPGILVDTVEYHVLVVSNLSYFKLPQHRETDVVQFVILKHFEHFEELRKALSIQYAGTVLPPISSSIFHSFLDSNSSERTSELEAFLKFIAQTPKLAISHLTLEFLGVNPLTAGKYTNSSRKQSSDEAPSKRPLPDQAATKKLFQEDTEEVADLFGSDVTKDGDFGLEEDIFSTKNLPATGKAAKRETLKLFDDESSLTDLEAAADNRMQFPKVSASGSSSELTRQVDAEDDLSDLTLGIEDDVERLLELEERVRSKHKRTDAGTGLNDASSPHQPAPTAAKPLLPPKPQPGRKPVLPRKPTQSLSKTSSGGGKDFVSSGGSQSGKEDRLTASELGVDDILKYINENSVGANAVEPDLFS